MRRYRVVWGLTAVALLSAGCSGGGKPAANSSTTRDASPTGTSLTSSAPSTTPAATSAGTPQPGATGKAGCAASVKTSGAKLQKGTIRSADLVVTFNACGTLRAFSAAVLTQPGLVDLSSADAAGFVKSACASSATVRKTKLCIAVGETAAPAAAAG